MRFWVCRSTSPPLCPPGYQLTATVVPFAAMARAFASAWSSPNSVSCWPCTSSVGAVMSPTTRAGEELARIVVMAGETRPDSATWT